MLGSRTEPSRFGVGVYEDDLPLRYDSNYLLVDELSDSVKAPDLIEEAARLARPAIMVRDEGTGKRLVPGFARRGWRIHHGLMMELTGEAERRVDDTLVREVDEAALRPARARQIAEEPWGTEEVIEQLLEHKRVIAGAMTARFFAGVAGDEVVAWTDLYTDGSTGQVEDVGTLREHRNRGYASALVMRGVEEARLAGCDLIFLVADADDWPKELYRKLGFEEMGRYVKFIRPD
jgi:ribosomal protein S18 acetylase RimI-like enzyme